MKYRNKVTGEIVDSPAPIVRTVHEFLFYYFSYGVAVIADEDFHAQYEPVKEDE